jgi:hypothetical protein
VVVPKEGELFAERILRHQQSQAPPTHNLTDIQLLLRTGPKVINIEGEPLTPMLKIQEAINGTLEAILHVEVEFSLTRAERKATKQVSTFLTFSNECHGGVDRFWNGRFSLKQKGPGH